MEKCTVLTAYDKFNWSIWVKAVSLIANDSKFLLYKSSLNTLIQYTDLVLNVISPPYKQRQYMSN